MEIKDVIMQMAEQDPRYAQVIDAVESQVARMPIVPEDLDKAIKMLEFVLQNPDKYPEVRAAAIQDGVIDAQMVPEQYDQVLVVSLLVALYGLQDRLKTQGYARGGLAVAARRVAAAGQGGDTRLAHINSREAEMLKRMGGSGTVNPNTGLQEYKSGGGILGAILPIALSFIVPGLGTMIGSALGAGTGIGASILGGAVIGGASSALTGGNVLKGALLGGLGSGLGGTIGGAASDTFKLGLGETGKAVLGGSLVGAGSSALTGGNVLKGALVGGAGGALGQFAGQNFGGSGAFEKGVSSAGQSFGNALTAGYDPKQAALMGLASGAISGVQTAVKPSDAVVGGLKAGPSTEGFKMPTTGDYSYSGVPEANYGTKNFLTGETGYKGPDEFKVGYSLTNPGAPVAPVGYGAQDIGMGLQASQQSPLGQIKAAGNSDLFSMKNAIMGATLLSSLSGAPPQVQQAVGKLDPSQQEYFNRPSVSWDWNRMQNDANAAGQSLDQFMATNLPRITGYASSNPGAQQGAYNMANGGALSAVARFATGAGSGRADTIDAKLSDGEYVIDAETVGLLGDGSNKEGAKRLDAMRRNIRSHKGKTLAKGKISPNAKSPLSYLKEFA